MLGFSLCDIFNPCSDLTHCRIVGKELQRADSDIFVHDSFQYISSANIEFVRKSVQNPNLDFHTQFIQLVPESSVSRHNTCSINSGPFRMENFWCRLVKDQLRSSSRTFLGVMESTQNGSINFQVSYPFWMQWLDQKTRQREFLGRRHMKVSKLLE